MRTERPLPKEYRLADCSRCKRKQVPFYMSEQVNRCIECQRTASRNSLRNKLRKIECPCCGQLTLPERMKEVV